MKLELRHYLLSYCFCFYLCHAMRTHSHAFSRPTTNIKESTSTCSRQLLFGEADAAAVAPRPSPTGPARELFCASRAEASLRRSLARGRHVLDVIDFLRFCFNIPATGSTRQLVLPVEATAEDTNSSFHVSDASQLLSNTVSQGHSCNHAVSCSDIILIQSQATLLQ